MKNQYKKLSRDELKKTYIGILEYIDKICRNNNIEYSIGCGTLLGAVRHGGFIPWDDDVDIVIMRSEYEKLVKSIKEDNDRIYGVVTPDDEGYYYNFAKVTDKRTILKEKNWPNYDRLGVNVDLFPQDYLPEDNPSSLVYKAWEYDNGLKFCLTNIAYVHKNYFISLIKRILRFKRVKQSRRHDEWFWKRKVQELVDNTDELPEGADILQIVATRLNQDFFRNAVLSSYRYACCITGMADPELLIASHIKPWKDSDWKKERTNPRNGLCLNALHDKAFDRGLLTVLPDYTVRISSKLSGNDDGTMWIKQCDKQSIILPERFLPCKEFLEYHNDVVFQP